MDKKKLAQAIMAKYGPEKGQEILAKLVAVEKVGGEKYADEGLKKLREALSTKETVEGATKSLPATMTADAVPDRVRTKQTSRLLSAPEFAKKIANSRAMRKGLHAVPLIGGVAAALTTGDAHAAIPFLGDSEALGPQKGDEGYDIENPPSKFKRLSKQIKE